MSVSVKLSAKEVAEVCVRIGLVRDVALESPKISLANLTSGPYTIRRNDVTSTGRII